MAPAAAARYLLDTNILLAYIRVGLLGQWIEATYALRTARIVPLISVVTEGEIWSLARQFGWGETRRRQLRDLLTVFVSVPLETAGIVDSYAMIDDDSRRIGRLMGKNDVWIAATAHVTGAILLTTDRVFDHLNPDFLKRDWIDPASHL